MQVIPTPRCPSLSGSEEELLVNLKPHFEKKLIRDWLPKLQRIQSQVTSKTARYIQQFIDKDGTFARLPGDIQCSICRYLSLDELFNLERCVHDLTGAVNQLLLSDNDLERLTIGNANAHGLKLGQLTQVAFGTSEDIKNIYRWQGMTRLRTLRILECRSLKHINFSKFINRFSMTELSCHNVYLPSNLVSALRMVDSLTTVRTLKLAGLDNQDAEQIVTSIWFHSLERLVIKKCMVECQSLPSLLRNKTALRHLNLAENYLSRDVFSYFDTFDHLTTLTSLNLRGNYFDGYVLGPVLMKFSLLKKLNLAAIGSHFNFGQLSVLRSLRVLSADHDTRYQKLNLSTLHTLILSNHRIETPEQMVSLSISALSKLILRDVKLHETVLPYILSQANRLNHLSLIGSFLIFNCRDLLTATQLQELHVLNLSSNGLTDFFLNDLAKSSNMTALRSLILTDNRIASPSFLQNHHFPYLQSLYLDKNGIKREAIEEFHRNVKFSFLSFVKVSD